MTDDMQRIIGTAIGRAYLEGAMWMLDARHDPDLSVKKMNDIALKYTEKVMAQIEQSIAAHEAQDSAQ